MIDSTSKISLPAVLAYVSLLHIGHLPAVSIVLLFVAAAASFLLARMLQGRRLMLASTCAALVAVAILLSTMEWRSGDTIVSLFLIAGWLKMAELQSERDGLLVWFCGLWGLAMAALWQSPGLSLLTLPIGLGILTWALAGLTNIRPRPMRTLKGAAIALPLTALLFVFTPRITGDLGVLSFALGIPLIIETQAEKERDPMQDGLAMGDLATRSKNDLRVLVATFFGGSGKFHNGPPLLGDIYWRGPVLWTFEEGNWRGRDGWEKRTSRMKGKITHKTLDAELRETGKISVYDVTLFPHRGHWLYAMDFPAAVPPSSFITRDYQLQNLNPVREILTYPMMSFLDYRAGHSLDDETRALALQYPLAENPRTLALGQQLRDKNQTPVDTARAGMAILAEGYKYDKRFTGYDANDAVDAFLFDRREGYASHFATAYVLLMRAAGIPARLIVGYRGGIHLGLTNRVYVLENHAHAWAEIWLDDYGWVRMDPAAGFAKSADKEIDGWGLADALGQPEQQPDQPSQLQDEGLEAADPSRLRAAKPVSAPEDDRSWWERWITDFKSGEQIGLLQSINLKAHWQNLIWVAIGLIAIGTLVTFGFRKLLETRADRRLPDIVKVERWACHQLAKLGSRRRPTEGLRSYLTRIEDKLEFNRDSWSALTSELCTAVYQKGTIRDDFKSRWATLVNMALSAE